MTGLARGRCAVVVTTPVTIAALDLPELFVGALVGEQIVGRPGMGRPFLDAVVYGYLDPRIRFA